MANKLRTVNFVIFITCLFMRENTTTALISSEIALKMTSLNNYRSTSGAQRELYARGVIECTVECGQTTGCLSFFYTRQERLCQLHDTVFTIIEQSFINVYQAYYYIMYTDKSNTTCPLAPPGAEYNPVLLSDGSTFVYRIVWQLIDMASATLACSNDGGELVRVLTPAKMEYLLHVFTTCQGFVYAGNYWIDGSNINAVNFYNIEEWVTSSGEALSSAGQYWAAGSPYYPEVDHCVALWSGTDYLWNSLPCSYTNYYICERF